MLTFDRGNFRFNYRAVGVIFHNDRVLLHKSARDSFWALPGGRVELMESAGDTVKREMREELGIEVAIARLLWVAENFFDYGGKSHHELGLYFLLSLKEPSMLHEQTGAFPGIEADRDLIFQWYDIEAIDAIALYPRFLKTALKSPPQLTEHLVHVD
jgi:8-oxo-dGTP pyrophosphatase MutT (NUDIX family)